MNRYELYMRWPDSIMRRSDNHGEWVMYEDARARIDMLKASADAASKSASDECARANRAEADCKQALFRIEELEAAFDDQTRELENAICLLDERHPETALEYRQRTYPNLYPR